MEIFDFVSEVPDSGSGISNIVGYVLSGIASVVATVYAMKSKIDILEAKLVEANQKIGRMEIELDQVLAVANDLKVELAKVRFYFEAKKDTGLWEMPF